MKTLKQFVIGVLLAIVVSCCHAVEIYGHRGAAGLVPENTLKGIQTALQIGVDAVDMDVGLTKDGIVVLSHDPYLNPDFTQRVTGEWLLKPLHLRDIAAKDIGIYKVGKVKTNSGYHKKFPHQQSHHERIPTLLEALQYIHRHANKNTKVQIEIKTDPNPINRTASPWQIAPAVIKTIHTANIKQKIEVHSFDWRNLIILQQLAPNITSSFLTEDLSPTEVDGFNYWHLGEKVADYPGGYPELIAKLGGKIWCPHMNEISINSRQLAQSLGLKVNVWTVDEPQDMLKMLDLQVDGIITNRPDILRGLMAARGLPLPQAKKF